jgi:hypothetical protein
MAVKYTKWAWKYTNIPVQSPYKIYPNWNFLINYTPGNPGRLDSCHTLIPSKKKSASNRNVRKLLHAKKVGNGLLVKFDPAD